MYLVTHLGQDSAWPLCGNVVGVGETDERCILSLSMRSMERPGTVAVFTERRAKTILSLLPLLLPKGAGEKVERCL